MENYNGNEIRFRTLGASFIVAYLYFRLVDEDYNGWRMTSTGITRANLVKKNRKEVYEWLQRIRSCNPAKLETNEMNLSYDQLMSMLDSILENWDEEF